MTDITTLTPYLADAAAAQLEDWGPLGPDTRPSGLRPQEGVGPVARMISAAVSRRLR